MLTNNSLSFEQLGLDGVYLLLESGFNHVLEQIFQFWEVVHV